ncbi:MAG: hypothetical protein ONB44_06170 [candidate division KSB1 bacterium]|nr:hypothetical protein [candidate division KSB1 bacterium]MDZ7301708.1 hypothetical protein [candidate division KSB1 bacterium]MDZ7312405.1 hypothetical protein [candidate division KSB1 bacterium]
MKRVFIAGLLGGLAVFVWGMISWMALPWHNTTMHSLANEDAIVENLRANLTTTGVFYFPGEPHSEAEMQAFTEKHKRGPLGFLVYLAEGRDPMAPMLFVRGLLLNLITAILAAYLLSQAVDKLKTYVQRVAFVGLLGVFAALVSHVTSWNWFYFPADYTLVMSADLVVAWIIAGLVIAWRIKPAVA